MFGSIVLEVAISLVFIYLILSMICSAVNELIMRLLAMRARLMWDAMETVLGDPALRAAFFSHPLIKGLESKGLPFYVQWIPWSKLWNVGKQGLQNKPAYIPSRTFALVIADLATAGANPLIQAQNVPQGQNPAPQGQNAAANTGQLARSLIRAFGNDAALAQKKIETWFDDAMQHVTGWYKRKTHTLNLLLGITLAVVMNADTFMLTQFLWYNPVVREKIVSEVDMQVKANAADPKKKEPIEQIKKLQTQLQDLSVPVGWKWRSEKDTTPDLREPPQPGDLTGWVSKIFGLLVTGVAVSLGAPFWFDLLKSLNTMRTTGKPPQTAEQRAAANPAG